MDQKLMRHKKKILFLKFLQINGNFFQKEKDKTVLPLEEEYKKIKK